MKVQWKKVPIGTIIYGSMFISAVFFVWFFIELYKLIVGL